MMLKGHLVFLIVFIISLEVKAAPVSNEDNIDKLSSECAQYLIRCISQKFKSSNVIANPLGTSGNVPDSTVAAHAVDTNAPKDQIPNVTSSNVVSDNKGKAFEIQGFSQSVSGLPQLGVGSTNGEHQSQANCDCKPYKFVCDTFEDGGQECKFVHQTCYCDNTPTVADSENAGASQHNEDQTSDNKNGHDLTNHPEDAGTQSNQSKNNEPKDSSTHQTEGKIDDLPKEVPATSEKPSENESTTPTKEVPTASPKEACPTPPPVCDCNHTPDDWPTHQTICACIPPSPETCANSSPVDDNNVPSEVDWPSRQKNGDVSRTPKEDSIDKPNNEDCSSVENCVIPDSSSSSSLPPCDCDWPADPSHHTSGHDYDCCHTSSSGGDDHSHTSPISDPSSSSIPNFELTHNGSPIVGIYVSYADGSKTFFKRCKHWRLS